MPKPRTHLVVGTPCYGGLVNSLYATSLMRLQNACLQRGGIDLSVNLLAGDALITRARQNIVGHFLEHAPGTHLIFIDADIAFDPRQVFRLLDFGVDMAAGLYPVKRIDWKKIPQLVKMGIGDLEASSLSYVTGFEDPLKVENKNGFAKVQYAGTGFLMIKRQALVKMIEAYPDLRYTRENQAEDPLSGSKWRSALFNCMIDKETGVYLSEDYSFCRRWKDLGGEIWVDLTSQLAHTGTMTFFGNAATQFTAPPAEPTKTMEH